MDHSWFFFALGWGLGVAAGIYLSKLIWWSGEESPWERRQRETEMIREAIEKERLKPEVDK